MPSKWKRTLALVTLPLSLLTSAVASSAPLTIDDAVQRTLDRHPAIAATREATAAAVDGAAQVESAWYPRVSLGSYYRYTWPVGELVVDTGIVPPGQTESVTFTNRIGSYHNAGVSLEAGWRVLDFGSRDAAIEAARTSARAVGEDEALRSADIAYAVRVAYLGAVLFEEIDAITGRSLTTARQELDDRQARLDAGVGSDLEVASATARVAELEARQVDVRAQRDLAHTTLRILLGMDPSETVELVDGLDALDLDAGEIASLDPGDHPSIRQLDTMAAALDRQADAVDRSFWPTLDVFTSLAYQFPWTMVDNETAGFAFNGGVSLSWPLFDGFQRANREDELRTRAHATTYARMASEEEITRERLSANARLQTAEAQLEAARRQIEAAETYLRVAHSAYSAGAGTALDILDAENAVDMARLAEARARFDAAVANADLLRTTGIAAVSPPSGTHREQGE